MAPSDVLYKLPFGFAKAAVQYKGADKSATLTDSGTTRDVYAKTVLEGLRVLYVSPLKALSYDVERTMRAIRESSLPHEFAEYLRTGGRRGPLTTHD